MGSARTVSPLPRSFSDAEPSTSKSRAQYIPLTKLASVGSLTTTERFLRAIGPETAPASGRSQGWAPVGKQLRVKKTCARQTSTSVIACASETRWEQIREVKGGVNKIKFCEFIRSLDLPTGSVILLDNVAPVGGCAPAPGRTQASIHKGDEVNNVFKEKGFIKLYVPPYSPWFNPIEGCFSIVKRQYPVKQNIQDSFDSLTQLHFSAFFKKSLSSYGVDEEDALVNTVDTVAPTPSVVVVAPTPLAVVVGRPQRVAERPLQRSPKTTTSSRPFGDARLRPKVAHRDKNGLDTLNTGGGGGNTIVSIARKNLPSTTRSPKYFFPSEKNIFKPLNPAVPRYIKTRF